MKQLCLRFDVDSHRCLREGVPALLDSLDAVHAPATFFVNMGRLTSRTRVARQYVTTGSRSAGAASKQTLPLGQKLGRRGLAVALVQNPRVGASTPGVVADAARRGHEIGLHGGRSHRLWQDDADGWDRAVVSDEIAWGLAQLARAGVTAPAGFSSPGWTTSPTVAAVVREQGFAYLADGHAHGRAQPWRDEDGLVHLPTNVVGEPGGVGYLEWHRAQRHGDDQIVADFTTRLDRAGDLAVMYDHPFHAGIADLDLLLRLVDEARGAGWTIVPLRTVADIDL